MPYEITATRKRPRGFEELAGQDFVAAALSASLESSRIAHAYLFSGPRGCGKTSTARILAKALNCEKGPTARPCGECASCRAISAGSSLDVIEIDGASNTSVDNVRQIKDEVLFPPNGGRYKVYIIDEVHMLSMSAFNALLKTIEEPPPYVVFIFATTELHKVPATIKSRCQQFAFRLVPFDILKRLLATAAAELGVTVDDEALVWIAKEAAGSARDAYTLFDQVLSFSEGHITAAKIRDKLGIVGIEAMNALFEACVAGEGAAGAALEALDAILARGVSPEQAVVDAVEYCRALLLLKNGIARESLLGAAPDAYSRRVLDALSSEQVERALAGLLELHRNIRFTVDPRFELELVVARLVRLRDYVPPSELARVVASLRRKLAGEAPLADAKAALQSTAAEGGEGPTAMGGEKKNAELPTSLKSAFSSLAAAALGATEAQAPLGPAVRDTQRVTALSQQGSAQSSSASYGAPFGNVLPDEVPSGASPSAEALRETVIAALGRASPLLKSGLGKSLPWRIEGERVVLPFRSGMEESLIRGELPAVSQAVAEAAGRPLRVELRVEAQAPEAAAAPRVAGQGDATMVGETTDPVAIVERVFRGSRVKERQTGGSDELQ